MEVEEYANVWEALADTPAQAANLSARSELMILLRDRVTGWGLTQTQAARRLGLTQPRLNDLMRGKLDKFSLDALVNLIPAAGLTLHMQVAEAA